MVTMINPFDTGGYTLAEMTEAINILPNVYSRLGQMGLFRFEGVTQRSVVIEQAEGVLNLLPTVPLGGPATVANRDTRSMRSFTVLPRGPRVFTSSQDWELCRYVRVRTLNRRRRRRPAAR